MDTIGHDTWSTLIQTDERTDTDKQTDSRDLSLHTVTIRRGQYTRMHHAVSKSIPYNNLYCSLVYIAAPVNEVTITQKSCLHNCH